jgi:iron complex outermembrane receptor protein
VKKSNRPAEIGQRFSNSPEHMTNLWASYRVRGLQLGAGPRFTSARYIGVKKMDAVVLELPSYKVIDAMASYVIGGYKLQFNINNILGEKYAQSGSYNLYVPGAPRNFLFTLAYSLKKP